MIHFLETLFPEHQTKSTFTTWYGSKTLFDFLQPTESEHNPTAQKSRENKKQPPPKKTLKHLTWKNRSAPVGDRRPLRRPVLGASGRPSMCAMVRQASSSSRPPLRSDPGCSEQQDPPLSNNNRGNRGQQGSCLNPTPRKKKKKNASAFVEHLGFRAGEGPSNSEVP